MNSLILDTINPKMLPFLGEKKSPTERNKNFHISICIRIISKPKERWLQFCSQRGMSQMLPAAMEATRHISKMISLMKRHGFCLRLFKEKREVIEIPQFQREELCIPNFFDHGLPKLSSCPNLKEKVWRSDFFESRILLIIF